MDKELAFFTSGQVAKQLQIPRAKLLYLIEKGDLSEASSRVAGRRLVTKEDIKKIEISLKPKGVNEQYVVRFSKLSNLRRP
jgi:DNA-binding transcriptional MerR regulator